jgi:hypothetical protein
MKIYIRSILTIATVLLVGCSNSKINNYENYVTTFIADEGLTPLESIDSLYAVDLFVLNNQHIALVAQNQKSYLLTTPDNCENMYFAGKLILLNSNDGVVKVNSGKVARVGDKYTECTITGIYKLHSVQLNRLSRAKMSNHNNPQSSALNSSSSYPRGE